jgi:hypothetical protein
MPRRTTRRKRTTRRRTTSRFNRSKAKSGALTIGRSAKNIAIGAALYEATSRIVPNRFGDYQMAVNLGTAGLIGNFMGAGQKDLLTSALKIGTRRAARNLILPRLGLATAAGNNRRVAETYGT